MTDREKLLDILMDNLPDDNPWEGAVKTLLDHLLAHGVVVREKGEWVECVVIETDTATLVHWECPSCGIIADRDSDNFCPNCGADMRRRENG